MSKADPTDIDLNKRTVSLLRSLAKVYRTRAEFIHPSVAEDRAERNELMARAEELETKANLWEKNPV